MVKVAEAQGKGINQCYGIAAKMARDGIENRVDVLGLIAKMFGLLLQRSIFLVNWADISPAQNYRLTHRRGEASLLYTGVDPLCLPVSCLSAKSSVPAYSSGTWFSIDVCAMVDIASTHTIDSYDFDYPSEVFFKPLSEKHTATSSARSSVLHCVGTNPPLKRLTALR